MVLPVSDPSDVFEIVPESMVGRQNVLASVRYHIRPITDRELPFRQPLSKAVYSLLNARAGVKGLSSSQPLLPEEFSKKEQTDQYGTAATEAALTAQIKAEIRQVLGGNSDNSKSYNQTDNTPALRPDGNENGEHSVQKQTNIHSLGQNEMRYLGNSDVTDNFVAEEAETELVGVHSFQTPAEAAARQNVFDLSTVFDPSSMEDMELFGVSAEDSDDSEYDEDSAGELKSSIERLKASVVDSDAALDAELDVVIGESYGIVGDLKNIRKKKSSSASNKASQNDDIWAAVDTVDVSEFGDLVPDMAISYPFNLDVFQKRAVHRLERDENVFVAAHTSAGKTVVAEYAIALAMQRKTKVIYTSPIKTLSNQKFRDFTERFGDVGIITGDISLNPEASCLVMTTEILRSMLYKGADLIRDLSHVIFDECHWLNDPERGVVWEESIILLPAAVTIVMLSATVPNATEFAKWVGRTKQKPVYVVSTPKRPVPLSHQIFVKGNVYPLFDSSQGRFLDANYRRATAHHKESTKSANIRFGGGRNHAWMPLIKYLRKRDLDPAIFFCFSKRKCGEAADQLRTQDLTNGANDRNQIHMFYQSAIARLSPEDRNVPQVVRHREMLKRGIGVHHAGVLPIIKEITEVLFQRGLVRILFATETFAMGVNMPARTVVFTAINKYDSQGFRLLEPGEYVQMAGRAGRRGLDEVGTVLLFLADADFPTESDVKLVLTGTPKPLRSQFRLTYHTILNLFRIDELRVEDVMARSFSEAPAGRTSSVVKKLLEKGKETLSSMQRGAVELERFRDLYHLSVRVDTVSRAIGKIIATDGKNSTMSLLGPGRVVILSGKNRTFRLGVIVKGPSAGRGKAGLSLKSLNSPSISQGRSSQTSMKILKLCGGPTLRKQMNPLSSPGLQKVDLTSARKQYNAGGLIIQIEDVSFGQIHAISSVKIDVDERGLVPIRGDPKAAALSSVAEKLHEIACDETTWYDFPIVHVRKDLGLQNLDAEDYWEERKQLITAMNQMVVKLFENDTVSELENAFEKLSKESILEHKLEMLRVATSDESLQLMPDYKQRANVLEKLGYIDGTSIRLKGRAACEVNTCDCIILTELVFEKVLQKLTAVDLAALLSALVFNEKIGNGDNQSGIDDLGQDSKELVDASKSTLQVLNYLGTIQGEIGIATSGYEYMRSNAKFGFMKGVKEWASGKRFAEICELYDGDIADGTIVRTIVRLCELLRELKNIGRVIGDPELQGKADEAIQLCKRDIIFAASLYVQ